MQIMYNRSMTEIPLYFGSPNFSTIFEEANYFQQKEVKLLHLGAFTGHGTRWMLERVNGTCVDVDTWKGSKSSEGHLDGIKHNHDNFYTDEVEKQYDETTSGLAAIKFKGTTVDFFKQNTKTFDFIYIDASHKKIDVSVDLEESWKILNKNGIIACDDYLWELDSDPELIPHYAINEFIENHKEEIEVLINNYQLWFKKL